MTVNESTRWALLPVFLVAQFYHYQWTSTGIAVATVALLLLQGKVPPVMQAIYVVAVAAMVALTFMLTNGYFPA